MYIYIYPFLTCKDIDDHYGYDYNSNLTANIIFVFFVFTIANLSLMISFTILHYSLRLVIH